MRARMIALGFGLFLLCLSVGCDKLNFLKPQPPPPKEAAMSAALVQGTLVAQVNNLPLTLEELKLDIDEINSQAAPDRPEDKITTRDQKIDYLKNQMVQKALLYQEALARGLDRKEEIRRVLEKNKRDILVAALFGEELKKIEVTSKEIEDFYNSYKDSIKEQEERQLREIAVSTEQEAKDLMIQLLQGADFATLAKERSKSASAKDGGDLGFIDKGKKSAQLDTIAFADTLEVGKISSYFKGADGYYYILKLEAKRGGKQRPLSEVWDEIKSYLTLFKQDENLKNLIGKLSREARIEIREGEIK